MNLSVHEGSVVNTIVVNGERFGANSGGIKNDVPMQEGEIILQLEYGFLNYPNLDYSEAICGLYFVTNIQKHGPYAGKVTSDIGIFLIR